MPDPRFHQGQILRSFKTSVLRTIHAVYVSHDNTIYYDIGTGNAIAEDDIERHYELLESVKPDAPGGVFR